MTIEALGTEGDGLARLDGLRLVVPGALPGERHRVRLGESVRGTVLAESAACLVPQARAEPPCPHFGACGGCVAQHLPQEVESDWKCQTVRRALARRGLEPAVSLGHRSPLASRRRLRLAIARRGGGIEVGFRARRSHELVDVSACPIAMPALEATIDAIRVLAPALSAVPLEAELTAYDAGVEVVLRGDAAPALDDRERLARWAAERDLARVAWRAAGTVDPIAERRTPTLAWPALTVAPPPGAFLQATTAGEAFLQAAVAEALAGARRVVDLFAGIGTLAAAARTTNATVAAFEQGEAAAAALRAAGVATTARDLDRRPLQPDELRGVDAVVIDPPRRGAAAQALALARSDVERIVHVACSPVSFARDAATLVDGGFVLDEVLVVDQFRFSAEVELIARFQRQKEP